MNTAGQGPHGYAPYPPQQQYYAQQEQQQPQYQHGQQYQQYQQYQQKQQPYQPPQQPQYYYPPQHHHHHHHHQQPYVSPLIAAPQVPPTAAAASHPQHFFAELDASSSMTPAVKPGPTPTSTSSPPTAAAQAQHGTPGTGTGTVFEMPAEPTAPKPDDADKPQTVAAAATSPTGAVATANPHPAEQAGQKPPPPPVQANPWGFFLPDDNDPAKESPVDDQTLAVKPLRIVKTCHSEGNPGGRPQGGGGGGGVVVATADVAPRPFRPAAPEAVAVTEASGGPRPVGGSHHAAQLAPAPLNITRPQSPAAQHRPPGPTSSVSSVSSSVSPSASQLPYPVDGAGIPTPDSHPVPQPGTQLTLPIHPAATGSPLHPASPTAVAHLPLTPSPTGAVAPQQYHVAPRPVYTQASPVSPIVVQAGLPPTLPMGSYFPQQPSYAHLETTWPAQAPTSAHHSPTPSVSDTAGAQPGPQTGQHCPSQPYASPPPSYNQAMVHGQPAPTSPTSLPQFPQPPPPPPAQPLSPNPAGVPLPMSPPPSQYPYSPSCVGADKFGFNPHQPSPAPPSIPQPSYINGPQSYYPTPPPLPPRTSPPTPVQYGQHPAPSPYGPPPPTRPNYQASPPPPPPRPDSRFFSSATARKLLSKTTELVDQTITPYLQDHRPRPLYNAYQHHYQHLIQKQNQNQSQPSSAPQGQQHRHQQGYAPSQPTYAAAHAAWNNADVSRPS
ncbi:hypothetical protein LY76DRAFT_606163 [Colletotrichum caudatum]|nr:hypothetical protein LY76DRAFT_606163 [Colletotrichum caudatum]